jgi:hypothetical protein
VALVSFQPTRTLTLAIAFEQDNHFLLMVIIEGISMILEHSFGAALGTVLTYAYMVYLTTGRIVQQSYQQVDSGWFLWLRSVCLLGWTLLTWYQHVVSDVYNVPPLPLSLVTTLAVVVLAIARRSNWIILSSVSSPSSKRTP